MTGKKKKDIDIFARWVSIISIIISLVAIGLPYFQYKDSMKENLLVQVSPPFSSGKVYVTDISYGNLGSLVQVPCNFTISNTGSRKLSIIEHDITMGNNMGEKLYTGIKGEILSSDGNKIKFPITLDSGEAISGVLYVGIMVPVDVYKILKENADKNQVIERNATVILAKHGMDIYGNKIELVEYGDSALLTCDVQEQSSPIFWFEFISGRGKRFFTSVSKY